MARKPVSKEKAEAVIINAVESNKPVPPLTKTAEEQNFDNITASELSIQDLTTMLDAFSLRIHSRFPECRHCGEYVETKKRGVLMRYTTGGSKASKAIGAAIVSIRKSLNTLKDGGALYFKAKPKLRAAASAAGVNINEVSGGAAAPDAGHVAGGTTEAPKKRGRKKGSKNTKAAAAPAAEPKPKKGKKGKKAKAAAAPAASTEGGRAGKLNKAEKEALTAALKKVKNKEAAEAKYKALDTAAEREKYIKQLHTIAKAQKGKKAKAAAAPAAPKPKGKGKKGKNPPRGGRSDD